MDGAINGRWSHCRLRLQHSLIGPLDVRRTSGRALCVRPGWKYAKAIASIHQSRIIELHAPEDKPELAVKN